MSLQSVSDGLCVRLYWKFVFIPGVLDEMGFSLLTHLPHHITSNNIILTLKVFASQLLRVNAPEAS